MKDLAIKSGMTYQRVQITGAGGFCLSISSIYFFKNLAREKII
jgi:hypothetical protein